MRNALTLSFAMLLGAVSACGPAEPTPVAIPFRAAVNGAAFACDASYDGIGTTASTIRPIDMRVYAHDIHVLAGGERVPLTLTDGPAQGNGIALLDFEDDSGTCETGSPTTHTVIEGTVPADTVVDGVSFKLGVPEDQNHLDAATSPAPLNVPGLWWSWSGGYKFAKIDVASTGNSEFFFHLGATDCAGDPVAGFACAFGNLAQVEVEGLAEDGAVVLDIGALYEGVDVDAPLAEGDSVPGCMAFPGDPECPAMFAPVGLEFESTSAAGAQRLFAAGAK